MSKEKFFAFFSVNPFWGQLSIIRTIRDLHRVVNDRYGLLGDLDDERGFLRAPESFTETELLEIFRSYSRHEFIVLVDSLEELKALSDDVKFLSLCDNLIESNNLQRQE